jgi:hypothetical protein
MYVGSSTNKKTFFYSYQVLFSLFARPKQTNSQAKEIEFYEQKLREAKTYHEWRKSASVLDQMEGKCYLAVAYVSIY